MVNANYTEVYYIENGTTYGYNVLATWPQVRGNRIGWKDTSGESGAVIDDENLEIVPELEPEKYGPAPSKIVVHVSEKQILTLQKVTIEVYNKYVKNQIWGAPEFTEQNLLRDHFLSCKI